MKSYITLLLATVASFSSMAQTYDMSEEMINSSHLRSTYYTKSSLFDFGLNFDEFINTVDKTKPTVVHSHGCLGVVGTDNELKNFYTGLGFNFVMLDFHKRKDARPSCTASTTTASFFKYNEDPYKRVPPRVKELRHHIQILKDNGISTIYATGHSEGGMTIQLLTDDVELAVIHGMSCIPLRVKGWNSKIKYLHLVSNNDPILANFGYMALFKLTYTCDDRPNYTTALSTIDSHTPLADPVWKTKIKEFLSAN